MVLIQYSDRAPDRLQWQTRDFMPGQTLLGRFRLPDFRKQPILWLGGFGPAFTALAIAVALVFPARAFLGPASGAVIFFLYLAAVLIASWCGYLPGIAVVLTLAVPVQYLVNPAFTIRKTNLPMLVVVLAVSLMVSRTAATRHRIEKILLDMNVELERRVREKTAALEEANVALKRSEEQFRTLANAISQLCWIAHADGGIFWYNDRWYEYTGTSPEQMVGWGWQSVHDPTVLPEVMANWKSAIGQAVRFEMTFPLRGRDGEFRQFLTRAVPLKDENGTVLRWFGTNTDITERMEIERALQRSNTALSRANQDLGQFAYVAAHDLQEPLRTVVSFSQLLNNRYQHSLDSDGASFLGYVVAAGQRMSQLISDLLRYSHASSDQENPRESIDLNDVLDEAERDLNARIRQTGAQIVRQSLPVIEGDRSRIQQVVQNLLSNSLKYRRTDVAPKIEVAAELRNDTWLLTFRDNGQGFKPEYADRIFGMFKRLHGADVPGSGIGLAICKTIVERHGGRIWAESVQGAGSAFFITLPANRGRSVHV